MFISILCMFRAATRPSSGELCQYDIWYMSLMSLHLCTSTPNGHLYRMTYTRYRIDTINSPDDGRVAPRNM